MKKQTISVVLATFNEEANIAACINSVKDWVDEIIIVDEFSTDKTKEIAEKLGRQSFSRAPRTDFPHHQKQSHRQSQVRLDSSARRRREDYP